MTDRELQQFFRRIGRNLDGMQRAQLRRLRAAERDLFDAIVDELERTLKVNNGYLVGRQSNAAIERAVSRAVKVVRSGGLKEFRGQSAKDISEIFKGNAAYYRNVYDTEGRKGYNAARGKVVKRINRSLGIEGGKVVRGGPLDAAVSSERFAAELRRIIASAVAARITPANLRRQLKVAIIGTPEAAGILEQEHGEAIVATYTDIDRGVGGGFAQSLKFQWATYEGGLIETSRKFCRDRDGKVFNTVEAEQWRHDPDLPKTKAERESGVVVNYTPLANLPNEPGAETTSMGRWRCRHRVRWISEAMAKRLAPEKFN